MDFKKQYLLIILFGVFMQSFGQIGIFPSQTHWKQLKTNHFQLISPEKQEIVGRDIIKYLTQFQEEDSLLGHYRDHRTYIIYGDHAISNGFVGPGPYRSGLYLTPPQNNFIGPGHWVKNLVNHENHHFIQHADARQGLLKYTFKYFGDYADSFLSNVYLLGWYWEGDAVYRESDTGKYGRGHYSHFLNLNRLFAKKPVKFKRKRFTYAYNKPYNRNIPNHYNLGYEMVNYLSQVNNKALYSSIDQTIGRLKRLPPQIKNLTHKNLFVHYENALDSILKYDSKMTYIKPGFIQLPTQKFLHQTSITGLNSAQDDFYFIEQSYLKPAQVIYNQKKIFTLGQAPDGVHRLNSNGYYLTWNELRLDPNFSSRSYSEIMIWDKSISKKRQITTKSKSFSPALNPKSSHELVYLSLTPDYTFNIEFKNLKSGETTLLLESQSTYLRDLNFSEDGAYLTFIDQRENSQHIGLFDIKNKKLMYYNIPQLIQISNVIYSKNQTFILTADKDKYEYIYLYSPTLNVLKRSTQVASAFKHLQIRGDILTFDYQTIYGLRNGLLNLNTIEFVNEVIEEKISHYNHKQPIEDISISTTSYKDGRPRLKFHSVIPYLSTQDIQVEIHGNDFLRKNQFLYRFYQNFGSENSVHQLLYTYAHFPLHISTRFTHSNSGTRNMDMNDFLISSIQENTLALHLSYPTSVLKSGFNVINSPSIEIAYRGLESDFVQTFYGSNHLNIDIKNNFYIAKNKGRLSLSSPLHLRLTNRLATDIKKTFLSENALNIGVNLLNNSHFIEAEIGLISENTDQNLYRYRQEIVRPSTGYFLSTSSIGRTLQSKGVFFSDYSTHFKVKLKNTVAYPNMRFTDFIFLKRISLEPFIEQSHYQFRDGGNQKLRSYGSHITFDIQWVKSLPVQFQLTYAKTPDLSSNSSFIGFGLVF